MPKVVQKDGYKEVQNTGMENFASMLGAFVPALLQGMEKKRGTEEKNQNTIEDIFERRRKFEALDPEFQDKMKETSMHLVEQLYDDTRIMQMQKKKVPKGYKPYVPPTRKRTQSEEAELGKKLAESRLKKAEATSAESKGALESRLNEERLSALSDPKDALDEFFAKTGKLPSSTDELNAFLMTEPEARGNYRQKLVGTVEYKTAARDKEVQELMKQYQPQTQKDIDNLKAAADYIHGLADSMPAALPMSMEKERNVLERRRVSVSEANLGISRQDLAMRRGESHLKLVQSFVDNGMDPATANSTAQAALTTGRLPEGVTLPKDKKAELQLKLDEAKLSLDQAKILDAAVMTPQVQMLLQTMSARLRHGSIAGEAPDITPELKKLYAAAKLPFDEGPKSQHWLKGMLEFVRAPFALQAQARGGVKPTAAPGDVSGLRGSETAQGTATGPKAVTTAAKELSPEVASAVTQAVGMMEQAMQQATDDSVSRTVRDKMTRLLDAVKSGDEARIRSVLMEK
jgi:hypothetical protein